jgi:hypothetical protein
VLVNTSMGCFASDDSLVSWYQTRLVGVLPGMFKLQCRYSALEPTDGANHLPRALTTLFGPPCSLGEFAIMLANSLGLVARKVP